MFCDDETGSFSQENFQAAARTVAQWVTEIVRPAESGADVYVQWITSNSYADTASYESFAVPPVGPQPPNPGAVPTAPPLDPSARKTATAETVQTATAFTSADTTFQNQLSSAQQKVKRYTDTLINMPDEDAQSSDIWGCPQRATERFAQSPTDTKFLVMASDMDSVGFQEQENVNLHGATVVIINFQTTDVSDCNRRETYWSSNLTHDGAKAVAFFRPGDILPDGLFIGQPLPSTSGSC